MEQDKHGAIINSDGTSYFPGVVRKGKRDGLSDSELRQSRRHETEQRNRNAPTGSRLMTTRQRLRSRGQVRGSTNPVIMALRAVQGARMGPTEPLMKPPVSIRSSKPHYRKHIKRYLKKLIAEEETNNE